MGYAQDSEDDVETETKRRLQVIGIGASAGGIKALLEFFQALPEMPGAAFVVVVHLNPLARSELAQVLGSHIRMPVKTVNDSTPLEPYCVYVIPPNRQLKITDHEIGTIPFTEPRGHRAPIDVFLRSLAEQHGDGFAIILSGAGSDGALGVRAIKEAGGIVLVQSPDEAEYASMPRSAIATHAVDFVLPVAQIAARLPELIKAKAHIPADQAKLDDEENLRRVLAHLRVRTSHDFAQYKRSTLLRRVARRMQVTRQETLSAYLTFLREHSEEAQALLSDLLISVTQFFRDPDFFEALAREAIKPLFDNQPAQIRVWVPGCATGEEAYSIAMLLCEEAARHEARPEIQVFASDLDARALVVAREGLYPRAIEADVSEERLQRFFTPEGEYYRVKRELRDLLLFAGHSVLKDPPFSRLDLISCRNLLIYLDRDLQQQVLTTLHYALNSNGFLFLGTSESAEYPNGLFRTIEREARLYQSTGRIPERLPSLHRLAGGASLIPHVPPFIAAPPPNLPRTTQSTHREAMETAAPPSALVDSGFRVLHLSETAGRYLRLPAGQLSADITDLVRPELCFELRRALEQTFAKGEPNLTAGVILALEGRKARIQLQVRMAKAKQDEADARRALVFFLEGEVADSEPVAVAAGDQAPTSEAVLHLKEELELTQSQLRTTREASESANEELRAANEELQSINEEYRSTAEELETSQEELQSINEELQTVNSELKLKLESVSRANSDLQNLMAATDLAILFLDPALRIKRFTPHLSDLFNITPNDSGRSITDFTHQLEYEGLADDANQVLRNLTPIEREIRSRTGGTYLVRFRPYRTVEDKIDGVVVTFVDVTDWRKMESALRTSEAGLRREMRLVELSRAPIFVWDFDDGITQWNRGCEELYGWSRKEALGQPKEQLLKTEVVGSSFEQMKATLTHTGIWKGEVRHTTKDGRVLLVESQAELMEIGKHRYVMESTRDITQAKAWAERQQLLLRELTHRVKNTLTVIQSMVQQTWRCSPTPEHFIERLYGRVSALAQAHKLLVDSEWRGAELHALIQSQMASYIANNPSRLHLKGELVRLAPDSATPFGLMIHELATNAAKYGALSNDTGEVFLEWNVEAQDGTDVLKFTWQEQGGPAVSPPQTTGFGSRLIKSGLPGGAVVHAFRPSGVYCAIDLPLPKDEHDAFSA